MDVGSQTLQAVDDQTFLKKGIDRVSVLTGAESHYT